MDRTGATDIQIGFVQVAVSLGIILAWPILVPSAHFKLVREAKEPPSLLDAIRATMDELCSGGISTDTFKNGVGDFAFSIGNPVPARGIDGAKCYLQRLRTPEGQSLDCTRVGSFNSPVSDLPIDGYLLSLPDGNAFATIYISSYQAVTSSLPPLGLRLVDHAGSDLICNPDDVCRPKLATIDAESALSLVPQPTMPEQRAVCQAEEKTITGLRHIYGIEKPISVALAEINLGEAAAASGYAPAQYALGLLHWQGHALEPSTNQAKLWLERAAQQGHVNAIRLLGQVKAALAAIEVVEETSRVDTPKPPAPSHVPTKQDIEEMLQEPWSEHRDRGNPFARLRSAGAAARPEGAISESAGKSTTRSAQFEFMQVAPDVTEQTRRYYNRGRFIGEESLILAERLIRKGRYISTRPLLTVEELAEEISEKRGYLEAGSDAGMENMIDGSDPLFDDCRAAFIKGISDAVFDHEDT